MTFCHAFVLQVSRYKLGLPVVGLFCVMLASAAVQFETSQDFFPSFANISFVLR